MALRDHFSRRNGMEIYRITPTALVVYLPNGGTHIVDTEPEHGFDLSTANQFGVGRALAGHIYALMRERWDAEAWSWPCGEDDRFWERMSHYHDLHLGREREEVR